METTPNELKNTASAAGQYAADKAKQVANKAEGVANKVSEGIHKGQMQAEDIYETARDRAVQAVDASSDFVKKYPFYTVAGAAAIGFVAGVLLRRGRH
jgi:ElaB/YqjD/DUF883 family membrane-anchored ribosome-binding protein